MKSTWEPVSLGLLLLRRLLKIDDEGFNCMMQRTKVDRNQKQQLKLR